MEETLPRLTSKFLIFVSEQCDIWLFTVNDHRSIPILTYEKFPWFKKASVMDICKVKLLHGYHLYWPALDVDLELSSMENLENYPHPGRGDLSVKPSS